MELLCKLIVTYLTHLDGGCSCYGPIAMAEIPTYTLMVVCRCVNHAILPCHRATKARLEVREVWCTTVVLVWRREAACQIATDLGNRPQICQEQVVQSNRMNAVSGASVDVYPTACDSHLILW
jgi:hypothetical protein